MKKKIEKWIGFKFESSTGLTPEFASFSKEIKQYIKGEIGTRFELVKWSRGHFYFSSFVQNKETEKYAYFSCSDVRAFADEWFNNLLVRTAKNEKDYTGGKNNFCKLTELTEKIERLTR